MNNGSIHHLDKMSLKDLTVLIPKSDYLYQAPELRNFSGNKEVLQAGPPVMAMLIQNTNPMSVAPDLNKVNKGFSRNDLFTVVHEQFMTDTANGRYRFTQPQCF